MFRALGLFKKKQVDREMSSEKHKDIQILAAFLLITSAAQCRDEYVMQSGSGKAPCRSTYTKH